MEFTSLALHDFIAITGLKPEAAKACFDKQRGSYAAALASFAQSHSSIPEDLFSEPRKPLDAKKINSQLKRIYQHARYVKALEKCEDPKVWEMFDTHAGASSSVPAPASASGSAAPSFGFGSTGAATAQFGFGNSSTSTSSSAAPSFGFGVTNTAAPSTAAAAFSFQTSAKTPSANVLEASPEQNKPTPVYAEAKHFTGPFFSMPNFWEQEVVERAPLLNLDHGFLERNRETLRARLEKWLKGAEFYLDTPVQYVAMPDKDEYFARVIIKDAERTFFGAEHREKFYMFLYAMYFEFGNYGQAMSYLAGLCLLVLNEQETAAVLRRVAKSYIPGHWAGEAVGFATSAWVVERIMKEHFPDVAAHFQKLNFWPDTYLQKILSGLCIHVLRFEDLFVFLDEFMKGGFHYLLKFCLSMIEHFKSHLLKITDAQRMNELYEIMRLDSRAVDRADVTKILQRAPLFPVKLNDSLEILRSEVYQEKVAPRLARAPKTEAFEPCEVCEKNRPKWWCDELGAVCDECKAKHPKENFTAY